MFRIAGFFAYEVNLIFFFYFKSSIFVDLVNRDSGSRLVTARFQRFRMLFCREMASTWRLFDFIMV